MLLAVDLGNSHISFGVFDNDKLKFHWRLETKNTRTSDEYAAMLLPLMDRGSLKPSQFNSAVLCSVVPPAERELELFFQNYFQLIATKIHVSKDLGFKVNVDVPTSVGADRLANTAYCFEKVKLPAVVIDIGTAATFDVVSEEGNFEGGVIFPGVTMAFDSLAVKTSLLPKVETVFPEKVIGKNTAECIQAGILLGYCDLIDGLLDRTAKELGKTPTVILTGGAGAFFQGRLRWKTEWLPDLTLEGIRLLHNRL